MQVIVVLCVFLLLVSNICSAENSIQDCDHEIYHKCHQSTTFTDKELENVRQFLQKKYSKKRPIRKLCKRLHVRKDIKCLSDKEFQDFVAVIRQMHKSGFMDKMTEIHHNYWSSVHKYSVGNLWHQWFLMVFEKEMLRINPSVTLPYWDHFIEFAEPHKSKIWDLFGHAGTAANDYCVADGPFANMTFKVPTPHCYRRQFNPDGTINPWEVPEWSTAYFGMGIDYRALFKGSILLSNLSTPDTVPRSLRAMKNVLKTLNPLTSLYSQYTTLSAFFGHFKTHLSIGGFNGDMSRSYATNDPLFYIFHSFFGMTMYKWQLRDDRNLVPDNYDIGVKYDFQLKRSTLTDLNRDTLPVFTDISVKEAFQLGYGELCFVYDQLIQPINQLIKGHKSPVPKAIHKLKAVLPKDLFELYYPKFALYPNKLTFFDHMMPDIPDHCNTVCHPTPVAYNYSRDG